MTVSPETWTTNLIGSFNLIGAITKTDRKGCLDNPIGREPSHEQMNAVINGDVFNWALKLMCTRLSFTAGVMSRNTTQWQTVCGSQDSIYNPTSLHSLLKKHSALARLPYPFNSNGWNVLISFLLLFFCFRHSKNWIKNTYYFIKTRFFILTLCCCWAKGKPLPKDITSWSHRSCEESGHFHFLALYV